MEPALPTSAIPAGLAVPLSDADVARGGAKAPKVSVIIPARDEQANISRCLRSILAQQGIAFQVIVVDDHSTDRTAEITCRLMAGGAGGTERVGGPYLPAVGKCGSGSPLPLSEQPSQAVLIEARSPLPAGWTGKANALASALPHAKGEWLLFTDADTEHAPGSLAAAVQEAEQYRADLFSLSPEQQVEGFCERALMPVIFAELATTFRPRDVSDPVKPVAAANGQYLLIRRAVYHAIGGHAAVAGDVLEDVALARRAKSAGYSLRFRIGKGMVRTRMYRGWREMREGWTKNLALLFPDAHRLACRRMVEFAALAVLPSAACLAKNRALRYALLGASAAAWGNFLLRVRKAHFDPLSTALAACGLPLFAGLLLRSARAHREGRVEWKGRDYYISPASAKIDEGSAP